MTANGEEPANATEGDSAANPGAWSTGMEAMSVGLPPAASSSNTSVNAPAAGAAKKTKRGQFLAVPIPRVDPALGNGLIGVAAYIFKLDPADRVSPPSVVGAFAMWMDGGSIGGGLGGKLYMKEDRFRVTGGGVCRLALRPRRDFRREQPHRQCSDQPGGLWRARQRASSNRAEQLPRRELEGWQAENRTARRAPAGIAGVDHGRDRQGSEGEQPLARHTPTTRATAPTTRAAESRSMPASTFTPIRSGAMLPSIATK